MSTAQDSATTANAPTTSSPQSNPTDKMSQCEKVDVIETPSTSSLAPVPVTASQPHTQPAVSLPATAAPSSTVQDLPVLDGSAAAAAAALAPKKPSHFNSCPKPQSAPQSPGRSAVTKSKSSSSRPKRHRCRSCRGLANPMMGTCPDCELVFCNTHRMPEDHSCLQAESRRLALKNEHRETMMRNATRPNKIVQF